MQERSISVKKWLVWFLMALGALAIGHLAATAHAQQLPEMLQPGPLVIDDPDMQAESSDPATEADLFPTPEPENGMAVEACECTGHCECGSSQAACFWCRWLDSTCNMPQHHAYFPPLHGYYYFRPYHPGHITRQQQFVTLWGGDARDPYANKIFKTVYAEYEADRQAASAQTYRLPPAPKVSKAWK